MSAVSHALDVRRIQVSLSLFPTGSLPPERVSLLQRAGVQFLRTLLRVGARRARSPALLLGLPPHAFGASSVGQLLLSGVTSRAACAAARMRARPREWIYRRSFWVGSLSPA